ncbi:MAG TPA: O-methyltransferase [Saprospiraceae bacterium]|nr:O-methyltransferase [Saprospiraceae bacterium]
MDKTLDYCYTHTTAPGSVLTAVERATHLRTLSPQMLSGPYQGMLIHLIARMIQPARALEIGTFTGYTSICIAQAMPDEGVLHTIEVNDELAWLIRSHLEEAGLEQKVRLHIGDAAQVIPTLDELFDLVFLDAGKLDYARHYELALAKTRPGGFLLADNVLWDGKVAGGDEKDETARVLRDFNDFIHHDPRVENVLLPVRDGIMLIRKI